MKRWFGFCLLFLSFAVVARSEGATYYVDSMNGSDTNTGSSADAAWKSLSKVNATTFSAGDRILLKTGSTWTGQLWPKGSGKDGAPIVVATYGGTVKPVINGAGLVEATVLLRNQEYWEIQDLEITNSGSADAVRRGVQVSLVNYGDAHHIYLRGLTIHDVHGTDRVKHNGGINYTSVGDKKPSRFIDLRIENNEIYRVERSGIFGWSDRWERYKWFPSLQVAIRGNHLYDIGGDGIVVVATDGAVVEHNVVGRANQRSAGYNVAIWAWSADNTTIQYNEAYGTKGQRDSEGFDSDWNSRNTLIQYNYSHDNDGGFLLICDSGDLEPKISIGNTGTIVRYNISVNDRTRGINLSGPVKNTLIHNNTIVVGPDRRVDLLLFWNWHGWTDGTSFFNNVFYVEGTGKFSYGVSRASNGAFTTAPGYGQSKNNVFDANVYWGVAPIAEDAHAIAANPGFVHAVFGGFGREGLSGFQLSPDSPARGNARLIENNGGKDFFGTELASCKNADRGAAQSSACER